MTTCINKCPRYGDDAGEEADVEAEHERDGQQLEIEATYQVCVSPRKN